MSWPSTLPPAVGGLVRASQRCGDSNVPEPAAPEIPDAELLERLRAMGYVE